MPAVTITPADLDPFATIDVVKAQAMIDDALALAAVFAPCILTDDFVFDAAAKAIIRGAILRWNEAGSGAVQSVTTGPFGMTTDTKQPRRGMFWPSEIDQLRELCQGSESSGAFAVDTVGVGVFHLDICDLNLGGLTCSCGASLTGGWPIYEGGYCW
jgi:hypothetical protein